MFVVVLCHNQIITNMKNRTQLVEWLSANTTINNITANADGSLEVSAENGYTYREGYKLPLFDYYSESELYSLGILNQFLEDLDDMGWVIDCINPGTYQIWR